MRWLAQSEALRFSNVRGVAGAIPTPIMAASRGHLHSGQLQLITYSSHMSMDQFPSFRAVFCQIAELRSAPAREIASNRGARHDAYEIDANEMDADAVMAVCSWILSEMVRFSQKGLDLAGAKARVEGLMRRRFPFTEEIDSRVYTEVGTSAPDTALGILFYIYPKRMPEAELIESLERHGYKHHNASVAVERLKPYVDTDAVGNVRLRNTGVRKAEGLISRATECNANKRKIS
jgi:hypothetical protein